MIVECKFCKNKFDKKDQREFCSNRCNIMGNIKIADNGCWEWQKGCDEFGYGHFRDFSNKKQQNTHRISYKTFKGEIPKGKFVCHQCDNPKCVNPSHLWIGSCKENMQDASNKGRTHKGNTFGAKLSIEDVLKIRKEYGPGMGYKKLGKKYSVDWSNIRAIVKRRSWGKIE